MNIGDWPEDLLPYQWEFYLQPNSRTFNSPMTRSRQVLVGQGRRWIGLASFRFSAQDRRRGQKLEAWLDKLEGQANTVNVWDFGQRDGRPLGPMLDLSSITTSYFVTPGTPDVITKFSHPDFPGVLTGFSGSSAGISLLGSYAVGDETVTIRGFPQGTAGLYAGDNVGLGGYLYRLTEDATADGLNRAVLHLNRPLVTAVDRDTELVTTRPRTPMQLLDDDQSRRRMGVGALRDYVISFVESFT